MMAINMEYAPKSCFGQKTLPRCSEANNIMVRIPEFQLAMFSRPSLVAVFRWPSFWVFAQIPSEHPGVCLR